MLKHVAPITLHVTQMSGLERNARRGATNSNLFEHHANAPGQVSTMVLYWVMDARNCPLHVAWLTSAQPRTHINKQRQQGLSCPSSARKNGVLTDDRSVRHVVDHSNRNAYQSNESAWCWK